MGTMTRLFGGESSDAISSKSDKLTAPTDASVITPLNPGNFVSIRTSPVVEGPRYFKKEEADALKKLAKEKTQNARHSKKAYKSLGQIEAADAKVHKAHRGYERIVATGEFTKKKSDVGLAKHLYHVRVLTHN
ncbi:hypothetical protein QUB33_28630 [Microcoleus sp. B3-A4]|uniref:hypothetical protein n=1 Tax=Microcoleus sp. B3-A4 TaxID=2818653 RepID=UPI002FD2A0AF